MRTGLWILAVVGGCAGQGDSGDETTDQTEAGPGTEGTVDVAPTDDVDGDGFTVAQGDCDDTTLWANPAWPEQAEDERDNDCDGRVDEVFSGLVLVELHSDGLWPNLRTIDLFGASQSFEILESYLATPTLVETPDFGGWYGFDGQTLALVGLDGSVTTLASLAGTDLGGTDEMPHHLAALPDGRFATLVSDSVLLFDVDGIVTVGGSWNSDTSDEGFEMIGADLAFDRRTGELGIAGAYGGFSRWTPEDGLVVVRKDDLMAPPTVIKAIRSPDDGGFYAVGSVLNPGIYRWEEATPGWDLVGAWPQAGHDLRTFGIEGETGDFYVSLKAGWSAEVWRMLADGSYAARFTPAYLQTEEKRYFGAVGTLSAPVPEDTGLLP